MSNSDNINSNNNNINNLVNNDLFILFELVSNFNKYTI